VACHHSFFCCSAAMSSSDAKNIVTVGSIQLNFVPEICTVDFSWSISLLRKTITEGTIPSELLLVSHSCYWRRFCIATVAVSLLIRWWLCMLHPIVPQTPPLLTLLRSRCALKLDVGCALALFPLLYYSSNSIGTCYSCCSCWCSSDTVLLGWLDETYHLLLKSCDKIDNGRANSSLHSRVLIGS
jgi:hypothetical protein